MQNEHCISEKLQKSEKLVRLSESARLGGVCPHPAELGDSQTSVQQTNDIIPVRMYTHSEWRAVVIVHSSSPPSLVSIFLFVSVPPTSYTLLVLLHLRHHGTNVL